MEILQDIEGFSRSLILIGAEIVFLVLLFIFFFAILRFVFRRIGSIPSLQKHLGQSEKFKNRIRGMLILLCILTCTTVLGYNGFLLYKQIDVYLHTLSLLEKIPAGFWKQLLIGLVKTTLLAIVAHFTIKLIVSLLSKAEDKAKSHEHVKSNDESISHFFTKLRQLLKNSIWFLVFLYATHTLFFPPAINNTLFVVFKIYLIVSVGFLVVNAAVASIDSLEALSKKYWYREDYLDWYNRISGLMPLFRRCLEYIIYVWVASLVVLQVNFIAQFASFGPSLVQIIGIFLLPAWLLRLLIFWLTSTCCQQMKPAEAQTRSNRH